MPDTVSDYVETYSVTKVMADKSTDKSACVYRRMIWVKNIYERKEKFAILCATDVETLYWYCKGGLFKWITCQWRR